MSVLLASQVETRKIRPNLLQSSTSNAKSKLLIIGLYYGRPRVLLYNKQNIAYIDFSPTYTICYAFQLLSTTHTCVAIRFAKGNAYLCSHAKLYDFINFASFLMLLVGKHIWNSGYRKLCYTRFRYASV